MRSEQQNGTRPKNDAELAGQCLSDIRDAVTSPATGDGHSVLDYTRLGETPLGMSNFDHTIDDGFEELLRLGKHWGRHAGWDFNGRVWFADGTFHEEVWTYHVPREVISAKTLQELMDAVNAVYGAG